MRSLCTTHSRVFLIQSFGNGWTAGMICRQYWARSFDAAGTFPATPIPVDFGTRYPAQYSYARISDTKRAVLFDKHHNLPPGWVWAPGSPLHFICHSQGGLTIRLLVELMSGNHAALHPVCFPAVNRQNWIKSVVTLGTPHKGTTVTDVVQVSLINASGESEASMSCLANSGVTYIATLTSRCH